MSRWRNLEELFTTFARQDLERSGYVEPAFAAFSGEQLQLLAWLRPFDTGAYADPMIELLALAVPLGADRLAVAMGGRVWSLDDPIPPVTGSVDLRQRALVMTFVDAAAGPLRSWQVLRPFDIDGDAVTWGDRHRLTDGEGWIGDALKACLQQPTGISEEITDVRRQARRVLDLGHQLYVSQAVGARLHWGGRAADLLNDRTW